MLIRHPADGDKSAIWAVMEPIIRAGETYALPRDMDKESALAYWPSAAHEVFVVEKGSATVGTYFLRANHQGGGAHVANCGYMTAVSGFGRSLEKRMELSKCSTRENCSTARSRIGGLKINWYAMASAGRSTATSVGNYISSEARKVSSSPIQDRP